MVDENREAIPTFVSSGQVKKVLEERQGWVQPEPM
jgi:hypothetical protein